MQTILVFAGILGLLVIVHELGHFVTARRAGIKVEEFGLGLPPRTLGVRRTIDGKWERVGLKAKEAASTIYSFNWIPLGGFVRIKGETGEQATESDSFAHKSVLTRIWVISAGVTMNIILAVVLLSFGLAVGSPQVIDDQQLPAAAKVSDVQLRILQVLPDSPAAEAGLLPNDAIVTANGQPFTQIAEFQELVSSLESEPMTLVVNRGGQEQTVSVSPADLPDIEKPGIGVALAVTGFVRYPWYIAPLYGIKETAMLVGAIIYGFYVVFKSLLFSGQLVAEVYGPVGIAGLVGDAVDLGWRYVIQFTAYLSVILAVVNYLPFPALDGGRALFIAIEGIRGKPVNPRIEGMIHNIGFGLLMLLILIVTYRDIVRVSGGLLKGLSGTL